MWNSIPQANVSVTVRPWARDNRDTGCWSQPALLLRHAPFDNQPLKTLNTLRELPEILFDLFLGLNKGRILLVNHAFLLQRSQNVNDVILTVPVLRRVRRCQRR